MLSDRKLFWIIMAFLGIMFIRNETRMDRLEDQIDTLNAIIQTKESVKYTQNDLECLTKNIYYEAGNQDTVGKFAVAHVTLNRVKAGRWGDSICKVVYAPSQFSWTLNKRLRRPDEQRWKESKLVALQTLKGMRVKSLNKSLYYHADYIKQPHWVDAKQYATKIGQHIFYNKAKNSFVEI